MPILENYHHFVGRHWETGSVANFYAYRELIAPHTGEPYSEAFLLGVSGGIVFGYFSFAYKGYLPHVALLTRNTFDPLDTLLARLGVEQEVLQTSIPERGVRNLIETLESGLPAITWMDIWSLPYFSLLNELKLWYMAPVLVYGYDKAGDTVWIADRARGPLTITTTELARARGRVKQDKHRILTLGDPDPRKLETAARQGIADTLKLFTGQPPKGSKENFGFAAYQRWRTLLRNRKARGSWAEVFPPGEKMVAGLETAFFSVSTQNGETCDAERGLYADFLAESSLLLKREGLKEAAAQFRRSAAAWEEMGRALLPDEIPPLGAVRALMLRRKRAFLEQGGAAREEIAGINTEIGEKRREAGEALAGMSEKELDGFLERLCERIEVVEGIEREAVRELEEAMTSEN